MLGPGYTAPLFTAPATTGEVDLATVLEKTAVVLYFFPKAGTGG